MLDLSACRTLEASLAESDVEVKRAKGKERELADELEKRRSKEKDDAIR